MNLSLGTLQARVARAAAQAGRDPADVRIVAVSKGHDSAALACAFRSGLRAFGENYVQEALPKITALQTLPVEWHFIGALQSNKAKMIPGRFSWVHALASVPAARRLSQAAGAAGVRISVLIQVNMTGAPQQQGLAPAHVSPWLASLLAADLPHLDYRGLMTLGPQDTAPAPCFAALRALRDRVRAECGLPGFTELSMGMSDDLEDAVREGATLLRVGRAIFGPRPAGPD